MTKIKGKYQDLKRIFDFVKLQGKDECRTTKPLVYNVILNCIKEEDKSIISCSILNASCTVLGYLEFYNVEVVEEGKLAIGNLIEFSEFLSKFQTDGEVTIESTNEKLIIKKDNQRKKAFLNLIAEEHIEDSVRAGEAMSKLKVSDNEIIFNELKIKNKFIVKSEDMKEVLDDGNISTFTRVFEFDFTPEKINCLIGKKNENNIENEILVISGNGNCKVWFQAGIDNVFSNLDNEEVTIFIEKDSPMFVTSSNDKYFCRFVIAPSAE